jgi:hypothetical protein
MPFANVNSVRLNYEILGAKGPWVALVSGARRNMDEVRGLATLVANSGFQVCALLMMRVTGGAFAVRRLSRVYYTQYIEAAQRGGMEEVCRTDHFNDLIALDPSRREQIMGWDQQHFVDVMRRWQTGLESGINDPMLGASERALKNIDFPVCVLPGNDNTHSIAAGLGVAKLIPGAELHELRKDQLDVDLIPMSEWVPDEILVPVVTGFFQRAVGVS